MLHTLVHFASSSTADGRPDGGSAGCFVSPDPGPAKARPALKSSIAALPKIARFMGISFIERSRLLSLQTPQAAFGFMRSPSCDCRCAS
jgi:hypothetical protein